MSSDFSYSLTENNFIHGVLEELKSFVSDFMKVT
jgi:hypothetical protein